MVLENGLDPRFDRGFDRGLDRGLASPTAEKWKKLPDDLLCGFYKPRIIFLICK